MVKKHILTIMKIGGIVIGIMGFVLFFWHLFRGEFDPNYHFGYASHQVMSVDSLILIAAGTIFYFWGKRRHVRRARERDKKSDEKV